MYGHAMLAKEASYQDCMAVMAGVAAASNQKTVSAHGSCSAKTGWASSTSTRRRASNHNLSVRRRRRLTATRPTATRSVEAHGTGREVNGRMSGRISGSTRLDSETAGSISGQSEPCTAVVSYYADMNATLKGEWRAGLTFGRGHVSQLRCKSQIHEE